MGVLRVLLALSVVFSHSSAPFGLSLLGGRTAVECFFVISGFYMALVIDRKYRGLGNKLWTTFIASRVARLLPVYLTIVAATLAASLLDLARGGQSDLLNAFGELSPIGAGLAALANLTLIGQDALTFTVVGGNGAPQFIGHPLDDPSRGANLLLIPPGWSLSIELAFYMLVPFILTRSVRFLVALGSASAVVKVGIALSPLSYDPWSYRFFPAELVYFIAGALAYRLLSGLARRADWRVGPSVFVLLIAAIAAYTAVSALSSEPVAIVFPLLFAVTVPWIFAWTSANAADRWIGDLSYPVYLVHILLQKTLDAVGVPVNGLVLGAASIAAGAVLLLVVDHPWEKWRQRRLASALLHSQPTSRTPHPQA